MRVRSTREHLCDDETAVVFGGSFVQRVDRFGDAFQIKSDQTCGRVDDFAALVERHDPLGKRAIRPQRPIVKSVHDDRDGALHLFPIFAGPLLPVRYVLRLLGFGDPQAVVSRGTKSQDRVRIADVHDFEVDRFLAGFEQLFELPQ